tara:strand:+ start:2240 stop:2545 length:306 start_codon:yes stop_codon:yes gene_type:complete
LVKNIIIMKEYEKGDIVVFLTEVAKRRSLFTTGVWDDNWLIKVNNTISGLNFKNEHPNSKDCSNNEDCFRHATQSEIYAYNQGIRNINDISKEININYEIY